MSAAPRFEVVEDTPAPAPSNAAATAGMQMVLLGLKTLSQRLVIALADMFTLLTVASAFWLWLSTPDPNQHQIVSLGMYSVFVLLVNSIVRRRKS
jgi:hypothetical protein